MEKQKKMQRCLEHRPNEWSFETIARITKEFVSGYRFLNQYGKAATFFGSSRCQFDTTVYQEATNLARMLSKDGFAIITGGGPGIMEAANKGAYEAGGQSAGLNIKLDSGQVINNYVKESASFHYFFTRKVMLSFASEVYIFFPGGFGTLDEFFEMVMLIQTKKIDPIPVVLVNREYWEPLLHLINERLYEKYNAISKEDMDIYHLVDSAEEAFSLIQKLVKELGALRCR